MSRGGVILAVAFTLALSPAAAAGQVNSQPDVMIVGRAGAVLTGDDLYGSTNVGQQRSMIVDDRLAFSVRIQNDGAESDSFLVTVRTSDAGFEVRSFLGKRDVTAGAQNGTLELRHVPPEAARRLRVEVTASTAAFGATLELVITAAAPQPGETRPADSVYVEITNISTPE
ncbi:MAG: hypothetical protein WD598_04340 [Acidimicrobiia bacterium]